MSVYFNVTTINKLLSDGIITKNNSTIVTKQKEMNPVVTVIAPAGKMFDGDFIYRSSSLQVPFVMSENNTVGEWGGYPAIKAGSNDTVIYSLKDIPTEQEPIAGYSLTTTEITSLKNGGVQSVKVKGVNVVSDTNIYVGDSVELVLPSNKYWVTAPVFYSTDEYGDPVTKPFTINGTNTATINYANSTGNSWSKIQLGSIANAVITGYTLTMADVNRLKSEGATRVVLNGSDVTSQKVLKAGDALRILIGGGKMWSVPPSFTNGADTLPFTTSDRWADVTYADNPSGNGWTSLNIGVIVSAPLYVFEQSDIDQLINSGVTLTMNGQAVTVGTAVRAGDVFLATAGANRYFYNRPGEYGDEHPSIYFSDRGQSGDNYTQYFTISSDFKTATYTRVDLGTDVNYGGLTSLTEQKTNVVGTNNVYLINEDILKRVNAKRFKTISDGGTEEITYDYGQFILSLLNIPFTVPADNIILPESILLANFDTGVSAPKINVDILTISLGSITVPATNNNLYDYVNTVALLHLPRMDSVAIELEYVIGHTISIEYLLDCYTGDATVNIYSDRIDSPIITKSVNIGVNIPYANTHNTASLDNGNIEVGGDNGVTTAFIELVKVDSILKDGMFTIPIIDEAVLNTATGFIQVENVELKTGALRNEKEMLLNILNNGVIIK